MSGTQRGKTTPDSTAGSFSPATAPRSRVEVDAEPAPTVNPYITQLAANAADTAATQLVAARARLADPATPVNDLADHTHDAIGHNAAHQVYTTATRIIEGGGNHQTLTDWAINGLCETPNDTYSGRRNDSRRVEHEARLKALTTILNAVRNSPRTGTPR